MTIHLRPELEELVRQDVQRGPYQTVDEFVEQAVSMLHEQEAWFASCQTEIAGKISEGWAAAERGELTGEAEVRIRMRNRKSAWLNSLRSA